MEAKTCNRKDCKQNDERMNEMTLIERWNGCDRKTIMSEMTQILRNYSDWPNLFCVDQNGKQIRYCVDNEGDEALETYSRKPGVCFSEDVARDAIKATLMDYTFLIIPWLFNDTAEMDLCLSLLFPVGYERDENDIETFYNDVIIKFEKCDNHAGFCVSKIFPVK